MPANFYSEIPTLAEIEASFAAAQPPLDRIFDRASMAAFLAALMPFAAEFDPPREPTDGLYAWTGGQFSYDDAMAYYAVVRLCRPATIIEVGCGRSTRVAAAALARNGGGRLFCVELYPRDFSPASTASPSSAAPRRSSIPRSSTPSSPTATSRSSARRTG